MSGLLWKGAWKKTLARFVEKYHNVKRHQSPPYWACMIGQADYISLLREPDPCAIAFSTGALSLVQLDIFKIFVYVVITNFIKGDFCQTLHMGRSIKTLLDVPMRE